MTGKKTSTFQQIANKKGWTFNQVGERWGISERQMSRVANSGNPRDLDAVKGLPNKIDEDMKYEQIVHDQALYCATEGLTLYRELSALSRKEENLQRKRKAEALDKRFSVLTSKCYMISYMYDAAERDDLKDFMLSLFNLMLNEATTALSDPEGWREACAIGSGSPEVEVFVPDEELRQWRLSFLSALKN